MKRTEYTFTGEVKKSVDHFTDHLQKQRLNENTIRQKGNYVGYYLNWLESERMRADDARYNDLLSFIDFCTVEEKTKHHVNTILRGVRDYYAFLKFENPGVNNPAMNLHVKGVKKTVIGGIVAMSKLESIYQDYPSISVRDKRNKIIVGMLIYQGVTTEELGQLETGDLHLKEGKITIPGGRRRNRRTLDLKPFQILEIHEYLTGVRPQILSEIYKPKPARKPRVIHQRKIDTQLFISVNGSEHLKNSLLHLFKAIQKQYPGVQSAEKIRKSVIVHWLKSHNLRQVQYMAGHKYVSSTERYQHSNLDNLKNKLDKFHPLRFM